METNEKMVTERTLSKFPNEPFQGTAKAGDLQTDTQHLVRDPTASTNGGVDLTTGVDYEPYKWMRGFEVHGVQSQAVIMVQFANGSIGRFDNITITADMGWWTVSGYWIKKILCTSRGTTATGVRPLF